MNNEIISIWKKLDVGSVIFNFSCGGDSMNDTDLFVNNKSGNLYVETNENKEDLATLIDYFDSQVYEEVEFYVNSDGHYQGESGIVEITLSDDADDFYYCKSSRSEWCENVTSEVKIELNEDMVKFISDKVLSINGDEGHCHINFKIDCLLTDKEEKLLEELEELILDKLRDFTPKGVYEDLNDDFTFSTFDIETNTGIIIKDNTLYVEVDNSYYCYT